MTESRTTLSSASIGHKTQQILNSIMKENKAVNIPHNNLMEEIAAIFSGGDYDEAITKIKNHINNNKGRVEVEYWFALLDCLQAANDRVEFIKIANTYAKVYKTSPPSWTYQYNEQASFNVGNILILPDVLTTDFLEHLGPFMRSSIAARFGRINAGSCNFEKSEIEAILALHKCTDRLKRRKVDVAVMGESNIMYFCEKYTHNKDTFHKIDLSSENPYRETEYNTDFDDHKQLIYLIYLQAIQKNGNEDLFNQVALRYLNEFSITPPGWEYDQTNQSIMQRNKSDDNDSEDRDITEINDGNIDHLIKFIEDSDKHTVTIDLSKIKHITYSSATKLTTYIQENDKKVVIYRPNHLVLVLLEMVGLNEFAEIIPVKR